MSYYDNSEYRGNEMIEIAFAIPVVRIPIVSLFCDIENLFDRKLLYKRKRHEFIRDRALYFCFTK